MTQTPDPTSQVPDEFETGFVLPKNFEITPVDSLITAAKGGIGPRIEEGTTPPLGPLNAFTGTFVGNGFNTIFRPKSTGLDNLLQLNLTSETLSFMKSLGQVPNRGMVQDDIALNGVPYLQTITDINDPQNPKDIHFEPGLWMSVPSTTDPALGFTLTRMASIPHGTTFTAQGTSKREPGKPGIPEVDITATFNEGINAGGKHIFPSQTDKGKNTDRLPVDLEPFIAAGTITLDLLKNPNLLLSKHIELQDITETITISIDTEPAPPLFGGGVSNIAFLLGNPAALKKPAPKGPNAQTLRMRATFWIETVRHKVVVGPGRQLTLGPETLVPGQPAAKFIIDSTFDFTEPRTITFTTTQIQYSQEVFLNFNGLTWPHVSVATLVPRDPIPIPLA